MPFGPVVALWIDAIGSTCVSRERMWYKNTSSAAERAVEFWILQKIQIMYTNLNDQMDIFLVGPLPKKLCICLGETH